MIAAIILSAGASSRMGQPKALLRLRSTSFLEAVLSACEAAGLSRKVVVLGPDGDKIMSELDLEHLTVVRNPDPTTGPIGSIRLAVREVLNHPVEGVLIWHVDQPHVALDTIAVLLDRFREGGHSIVVPEYRGMRGHPVVYGRAVFEELLHAPDTDGARAVVRADPNRVTAVAVDDPAVREDVDTPDAYRRLLRRLERADASPPPREYPGSSSA